ncbi:MAG: 23S rRNA (pseudouridine(1915)-N(3))-methyltransferase RlmH [Bdellovibrionota bacterium]
MKKIELISISRVKQDFILKGEREYAKRLSKFVDLKITDYNLDFSISCPKSEIIKQEGEYFLKRVSKGQMLVLLDEKGKKFNSKEFASFIEKQYANPNALCFAIGGAYGWCENVKKKADMLLSLSDLTFPYQLTRLIMVEQLYRAFTIINNFPYHKE